MAFFNAKNARVRFGSTTITAKAWEVVVEADELDTTNFEGGGFYECIGGIKKLTVTIQLDDDAAQNLFDAGVTAGATISTVKLYTNATTAGSGPYWSIPTLFVRSPGQRANVKETMQDTIQGNATGSFVYPTGTS